MSGDRCRVRSAGVCGEYGTELVDERGGERSAVGWDRNAARVVGEYEDESTDLAALAPDWEFHFVRGSEWLVSGVFVAGQGDHAVAQAGERGGVGGTFEACATGAEEFDHFVFDDGDQASGGSAARLRVPRPGAPGRPRVGLR